jgi:hypothetical protein
MINNDDSNAQKVTSMMACFLEETAKDGHFTGLGTEKTTLEKGGGKAKL